MYRHQAIQIARNVMAQCGITDELKPWVVDAILQAANGTAKIDEPVPVAWRRQRSDSAWLWHNHPYRPFDIDEQSIWEPLYALPVAAGWDGNGSPVPCLDESCPHPPIANMVPACIPKVVAWRRMHVDDETGAITYEWHNYPSMPAVNGGPDWRPVYESR